MPVLCDLDYGLMADTLGAQAAALDEPLALAESFADVDRLPEPEILALHRVRHHLRAAEHELRALIRPHVARANGAGDPHVD